jgi:hypothetical protein
MGLLDGEFDFPVAALDPNHAPQQLGGKNGRVVMPQPIPTGHQASFFVILA